jgi:hypothetical protein
MHYRVKCTYRVKMDFNKDTFVHRPAAKPGSLLMQEKKADVFVDATIIR